MTISSRASASRIITVLLGCLTAIIGFVAFNVVDGIFGVTNAILAIAACIATTVFVFRRSPPAKEDTDV
jgi:uncharacterized membrane protein YuzA (DUF378 family)